MQGGRRDGVNDYSCKRRQQRSEIKGALEDGGREEERRRRAVDMRPKPEYGTTRAPAYVPIVGKNGSNVSARR